MVEKSRQFKNNDKSEKQFLRGERNARYCDKILSNQQKVKSKQTST